MTYAVENVAANNINIQQYTTINSTYQIFIYYWSPNYALYSYSVKYV